MDETALFGGPNVFFISPGAHANAFLSHSDAPRYNVREATTRVIRSDLSVPVVVGGGGGDDNDEWPVRRNNRVRRRKRKRGKRALVVARRQRDGGKMRFPADHRVFRV